MPCLAAPSPLGAAAELAGGPTIKIVLNTIMIQPPRLATLKDKQRQDDTNGGKIPPEVGKCEHDMAPRVRRLNKFKEVGNSDRLNPQSIRRAIYDLLLRYFDGNLLAAAERLNELRKDHKKRTYKTAITQEGLYAAVMDDVPIKYLLLEAIAIERGIPVSLLLFYTRLISDQTEQDSILKNDALILGFSRVLRSAQQKFKEKEPFDFDDLIAWINLYKRPRPQGARALLESNQLAFPGFLEEFDDPLEQ